MAATIREAIVNITGTGPPPSSELLAKKAQAMLPAKKALVRYLADETLRPVMSPDGAKKAIRNPASDTSCIATIALTSGAGIPTQNLDSK